MFEVLLITDPAASGGIAGSVRAALRGNDAAGRVAVQLRAKALDAASLAPIARELREITEATGVALLINGAIALAREVRADGVHLPEAGPSPALAREVLGPGRQIGVSCHDVAGLERAAQGGADYATLSPVYESPGKGPPLGLACFARWTAAARLPVIALGGVQARHVPQLRAAGAAGVAVISAVFGASDPSAALRALLDPLP